MSFSCKWWIVERLTWKTLSHNAEEDPRIHLIGVVGTWDKVEENGKGVSGWFRYFALARASWAQISQCDMDRQVSQLAEQKSDKPRIDLYIAVGWRSIQWVVHVITDVKCETPIIGAILEEIHDRHSGVWEAMDEQSFKQSLCIVQSPTGSGNATETSTVED